MARPIKNYCDYFPHDRDMRNHRKIKAVRNKLGIDGYAIWSMILEYLTGIDGNVFEYSDEEFELISGDFGVSVETIRIAIDYFLKLELLFVKDGFIHSESLDENLKPVYEKRGKSKEKSKKQHRKNGKFYSNNTDGIGVSVAEIPQSKVEYSKEKYINISFGVFWDLYDKKVGDKNKLEQKWNKLKNEDREKIMQHLPKYKIAQPDKKYRKDPQTYLNNKSWNDEIIGLNVANLEIPNDEITNANIHQSNLKGLELSRKINWQSFFKLTKEQYETLPLNSKQSFNQLELQKKCQIA